MSGYKPKIVKTFEFDGDKVEVVIKPLSRIQFLKLEPFFEKSTEGVSIKFDSIEAYMDFCEDILKDKIQSLRGVFIDGEELIYKKGDDNVLFNEILSSTYFMELFQRITAEVILISQAVKNEKELDEVKKISPEDTQECATET